VTFVYLQIKTIEQYFPDSLYTTLHNVVGDQVDEILKLLSIKFQILGVSRYGTADEIIKLDHYNDSYFLQYFHAEQCFSNFLVSE